MLQSIIRWLREQFIGHENAGELQNNKHFGEEVKQDKEIFKTMEAVKVETEEPKTLLDRYEIEGTPFVMITDTTKGLETRNSFLTIGDERITEWEEPKTLVEMVRTHDWTLITKVAIHMTRLVTEIRESEKQLEKAMKSAKEIAEKEGMGL